MTIKTYSPSRVSVSIAGANLTGFGDGTMITSTRNNPNTNITEGVQGDQAITKIASRSGTLEITLLQNSESNRMLSRIQLTQDLVTSDIIRFDITVQDPSGGYLNQNLRCHISQAPGMNLADDNENRTWTFHVEEMLFTDVPDGFTEDADSTARITSAINTILSNNNVINSGII